jgi:phosphonate transport system substrate-binding protein
MGAHREALLRRLGLCAGIAFALRTGSVFVLCAVAAQAHEASPAVKMGVVPYLSPGTLVNEYAGLRDYLSQQLKRPVAIYTAPDVRRFVARTESRDFDILLTPPHLLNRAIAAGYRPLTAVRADFYAHILVPAKSPARNLRDLMGSRIHAPPRTAFASIAIERYLAGLGYQLGRDFRGHHHNSENNALLAAARSQNDAVAASRAVVQRLPAEIRSKLRVIGSTPSAVSMLILAAPDMRPAQLDALKEALARFPYSEAGLRYTEQNGAYLFPVNDALVRGLNADMAFAQNRSVDAAP